MTDSRTVTARLAEYQALLTCPYSEITPRWQAICEKWPDPRSWQRQTCYDAIYERNRERGMALRARKQKRRADPGTFAFIPSADSL